MFAKLLKHEWRATRGVIGLLCVIILISGLTIGMVMHHVAQAEDSVVIIDEAAATVSSETAMSDLEEVICVLLLMFCVIAVAVCCAASLFYVIYRFYKRCFTDEGYLTFTLPVTNHQILLSSITNCILSEILTLLAACAAVGIAFILFLSAINQEIIWADVWVRWEDVWQQLIESFWRNKSHFLLLGFSGIAGALGELIVLMLAVTIGSLIAKKHKILAAVGVYYGISIVQSFLLSALSLNASATQSINILLASSAVLYSVLAVGGYFLMHHLISRKLNLV